MKKRACLVLASLSLAACDENAIKFASETKKILDEYQKKIADEISETNKFYQQSAALEANASWRRLNDSLSATRDERSTALAADYEDGRKSSSQLRSDIRDYVLTEGQQRRHSLEAGVDSTLPYIQRLTTLQADKDKVAALSKMLDGLAKPRSLKDEATNLQKFVEDTKTGFDKLVCSDLLAKQKTASAAEKPAIDQLVKDKKCSN